MKTMEHIKNQIRCCWARRHSDKVSVRAVNRHQILADVAELRFRKERADGAYSHERKSDTHRVISTNFIG